MRKLSNLFIVLALVLSHAMCAVVAFNYSAMLCAIEHAGFSAPAEVALLYAIPYLAGALICLVIGVKLRKNNLSPNRQ